MRRAYGAHLVPNGPPGSTRHWLRLAASADGKSS